MAGGEVEQAEPIGRHDHSGLLAERRRAGVRPGRAPDPRGPSGRVRAGQSQAQLPAVRVSPRPGLPASADGVERSPPWLTVLGATHLSSSEAGTDRLPPPRPGRDRHRRGRGCQPLRGSRGRGRGQPGRDPPGGDDATTVAATAARALGRLRHRGTSFRSRPRLGVPRRGSSGPVVSAVTLFVEGVQTLRTNERQTAMRDIIVTEFISLDGVVEAPGGEGLPAHRLDLRHRARTRPCTSSSPGAASRSGRCCSGGATYEGSPLPGPSATGEFADKFNSMPKYVVSSTLTDPAWNNTTVIGFDDVAGAQGGRRRRRSRSPGAPARAGPAPGGPGRPVEPDGLPGHPRQRPAAVPDRRRGQAEAAAGRVEDLRQRRAGCRSSGVPEGSAHGIENCSSCW